MTPPVIEARNLSKSYALYERPLDRLLELLLRRPRHRKFRALEGVSFEVRAGEGLGIIGENGAGKSTLLKILAGIVTPTSGELILRGKVSSILELGSGFHPDLSGRANITLNAAMLGLSSEAIHERQQAIIEWSELGEFIEQPVKNYSTGMAMRLGFAIATQVDPDILIVDEALAVGDGYFQKKCMDRILALIEQGKTVLFCSHAMYYISAFCRQALWLRHGEIAGLGPVDEVVRRYESFLQSKTAADNKAHAPSVEAKTSDAPTERGMGWIRSVELPSGSTYQHRDRWTLDVSWESLSAAQKFHLGVGVNRNDEVEVMAFGTHLAGKPPCTGSLQYTARLEIPSLPLLRGVFTLYIFLLDEQGLHIFDRQILPAAFEVAAEGYRFGLIEVPHAWELGNVHSLESVPVTTLT